jgi:glycerophosphoryl diester phosphodiesterase
MNIWLHARSHSDAKPHRNVPATLPRYALCHCYAISQGVDVLELDMGVTKDGVVVVSHDPYLQPCL